MRIQEADGGGLDVYRVVLCSPPRTWVCTHRGITTVFSLSLLGQSLCHHATMPCDKPSPETGAAVGQYGLVLGDSAFLVCEEHLHCPRQAKAISACPVAGTAQCQTLLTTRISGRDGAARVPSWRWGSPSPSHPSPSTPVESTREPADGPGNSEGEWKGQLSVLFKNSKCPTPPSSDQVGKCSPAPSFLPSSTTGTSSRVRSSPHDRHPSCGICWVFT